MYLQFAYFKEDGVFDLRKIFDLRKFFAVPKNFLKSKIHCTMKPHVDLFKNISKLSDLYDLLTEFSIENQLYADITFQI